MPSEHRINRYSSNCLILGYLQVSLLLLTVSTFYNTITTYWEYTKEMIFSPKTFYQNIWKLYVKYWGQSMKSIRLTRSLLTTTSSSKYSTFQFKVFLLSHWPLEAKLKLSWVFPSRGALLVTMMTHYLCPTLPIQLSAPSWARPSRQRGSKVELRKEAVCNKCISLTSREDEGKVLREVYGMELPGKRIVVLVRGRRDVLHWEGVIMDFLHSCRLGSWLISNIVSTKRCF